MGCVLHFFGDSANVEELLRLTPVEPCAVYRKGAPRSTRPAARPSRTSGVSIVVSDADFDCLELQQADAIAFLRQHHSALSAMRHVQGVKVGSLDFGISMRNVIAQSDAFEPELLVEIVSLSLQLVLSQYPTFKGKGKKIKQYRRALRNNAT